MSSLALCEAALTSSLVRASAPKSLSAGFLESFFAEGPGTTLGKRVTELSLGDITAIGFAEG